MVSPSAWRAATALMGWLSHRRGLASKGWRPAMGLGVCSSPQGYDSGESWWQEGAQFLDEAAGGWAGYRAGLGFGGEGRSIQAWSLGGMSRQRGARERANAGKAG